MHYLPRGVNLMKQQVNVFKLTVQLWINPLVLSFLTVIGEVKLQSVKLNLQSVLTMPHQKIVQTQAAGLIKKLLLLNLFVKLPRSALISLMLIVVPQLPPQECSVLKKALYVFNKYVRITISNSVLMNAVINTNSLIINVSKRTALS